MNLRWVRPALLAAIALVLMLWLAAAGLRVVAMGSAERDALALMQSAPSAPTDAQVDNGYRWLLLADYDIPPEDVEAELAAELAHFSAWLEQSAAGGPVAGGDAPSSYVSLWQATLAKRPALSHLDPLCNLGAAPCLAKLRAEPDALRAQLARHAQRLAFAERSLAAPQFTSPYPPAMEAPIAGFGNWRLVLTAVAVDFEDGRQPQALQRGCGLLAAARRINRESSQLLERMVSQALAESAAGLLLDMRRDAADLRLPAECGDALTPLQEAEFLVCSGLRGEYRMHAAQSARLDRQLAGLYPKQLLSRQLLFDKTLYDAWVATAMAPYCDEPHREAALRGQLPEAPPAGIPADRVGCYGAYGSCVLASIATPSYHSYASRMLDHGARLQRLLAAHAELQ